MKKSFIALCLLCAVFLIACQTPIHQVIPTQSAPEPAPEKDKEVFEYTESVKQPHWSNYTNEEYGFSLNFPMDWSVEEYSQGRPHVYFISPERKESFLKDEPIKIDARIIVYEGAEELPNNEEGLDFYSWLNADNSYFDGNPIERSHNDIDAFLLKNVGLAGIESEFMMIEHDGRIYELNFDLTNSEDFAREKALMLESFHFTGTKQSAVSSTETELCTDENCFVEYFKNCESASMTADMGLAAVEYKILGENEDHCEVQMTFTKNPNPSWIDQAIVCPINMDLDFVTAWQSEFEAASNGKGDCRGPLAQILSEL